MINSHGKKNADCGYTGKGKEIRLSLKNLSEYFDNKYHGCSLPNSHYSTPIRECSPKPPPKRSLHRDEHRRIQASDYVGYSFRPTFSRQKLNDNVRNSRNQKSRSREHRSKSSQRENQEEREINFYSELDTLPNLLNISTYRKHKCQGVLRPQLSRMTKNLIENGIIEIKEDIKSENSIQVEIAHANSTILRGEAEYCLDLTKPMYSENSIDIFPEIKKKSEVSDYFPENVLSSCRIKSVNHSYRGTPFRTTRLSHSILKSGNERYKESQKEEIPRRGCDSVLVSNRTLNIDIAKDLNRVTAPNTPEKFETRHKVLKGAKKLNKDLEFLHLKERIKIDQATSYNEENGIPFKLRMRQQKFAHFRKPKREFHLQLQTEEDNSNKYIASKFIGGYLPIKSRFNKRKMKKH